MIPIGQERGDERMLLEGKKMYCDALRFLRMSLAQPSKEWSVGLLGTIMVLQVAESNMCMQGADWRNHTSGVTALMREIARSGRQQWPFGWLRLVERQFATFQFWDAVIARTGMEKLLPSEVPTLFLIAQEVPGVLQACDAICCGSRPQEEALHVAQDLRKLETRLTDWTTNWNRCMRDAPFEILPTDSLAFLHRKERSSTTFTQVIHFNDLTICIDHIMCSAAMLAIKRAMLDFCPGSGTRRCARRSTAISTKSIYTTSQDHRVRGQLVHGSALPLRSEAWQVRNGTCGFSALYGAGLVQAPQSRYGE